MIYERPPNGDVQPLVGRCAVSLAAADVGESAGTDVRRAGRYSGLEI